MKISYWPALCKSTIAIGLTLTSSVYADTTTPLNPPLQYCFFQAPSPKDISKFTLQHNFVVPSADIGKNGDIFIGFKQKSMPTSILLYSSATWSLYNPQQAPVSAFSGALQGVTLFPLISQPVDLTGLKDDGVLMMGYGLRTNANSTISDSFQEMMTSNRFSTVYVVGAGNGSVPGNVICLKATEMTVMNISTGS